MPDLSQGPIPPFDGARRRRIVLLRHAEAAYFDAQGNRAPDSRLVPLTERGNQEALNRGDVLSDFLFDRAICSGLPRTHETATHVLAHHDGLSLEIEPRLEEVRGGAEEDRPQDLCDAAYTMWGSMNPDATFLGGESFGELWTRVDHALCDIMNDRNWSTLLMVCHGGINRMIMTWMMLGARRNMDPDFQVTAADFYPFPSFEQDSCCINIFDIDQADGMAYPHRTIFRVVNHVPTDPLSTGTVMTTMEKLIRKRAASPQ